MAGLQSTKGRTNPAVNGKKYSQMPESICGIIKQQKDDNTITYTKY